MSIYHRNFGDVSIRDVRVVSFTRIPWSAPSLVVADRDGNKAEFTLQRSPDLNSDLSEIRGEVCDCSHEQTAIRTKLASNGREMIAAQCLNCGNQVGTFIKKELWPEHRPAWDESIRARLDAELEAAEAAVYLKHLEIQQREDEEYGEYLRSPEWREKRRLVLERDNGLCQGCRNARATQVHHLTYRHIFAELLFELIAVCDACHERIHQEEAVDAETT